MGTTSNSGKRPFSRADAIKLVVAVVLLIGAAVALVMYFTGGEKPNATPIQMPSDVTPPTRGVPPPQ